MSLKAFHIVFVIFTTLFAFGCGIWCLWVNQTTGTSVYTTGAVISFLMALVMVVYGCWFWRKMKRLRLIS